MEQTTSEKVNMSSIFDSFLENDAIETIYHGDLDSASRLIKSGLEKKLIDELDQKAVSKWKFTVSACCMEGYYNEVQTAIAVMEKMAAKDYDAAATMIMNLERIGIFDAQSSELHCDKNLLLEIINVNRSDYPQLEDVLDRKHEIDFVEETPSFFGD